MKLLLPAVFLALTAAAYGASVTPTEASQPVTELVEEDEEYRWKQSLGRALEKIGRMLQGKYTVDDEEERQELEMYAAAIAEAFEEADAPIEDDEEDPDRDVTAYGLRKKWKKWRKKLEKVAKGVVQSIVINKAVGAVAAASG